MIAADLTAGSCLLGLGHALPDAGVTTDELGARFGKPAGWVRSRTGIARLHRADSPSEVRQLAAAAATSALANAGLTGSDVDLVITATCSVDAGLPGVGAVGPEVAPRAARLQLNSACSGFSYALATADSSIRTGAARYVLVVGVEQMSSLIDPDDPGTSILFGDGAGAAVLGPSAGRAIGVGPTVWGSDGASSGLIDCGGVVGGRMRMAGRAVFRWAVERMPAVAVEACARAGVAPSDLDVFVPHQANLRIVHAIAARLGLDGAVIADHIETAGNTSAASIPMALSRLLADGRARSGQLALLLGFGAGLSWAGQVVCLP